MTGEHLPDWQQEINDCERCKGARWLSVAKMGGEGNQAPGAAVPCDQCNADGHRELFDSPEDSE